MTFQTKPLSTIEIILNPYSPPPLFTKSVKKGPYYKKRLKKAKKKPKNWKIDIHNENGVFMMHPDSWNCIEKCLMGVWRGERVLKET
jgi:hypothetical protein